ncbi:hypothetical protein Bca52824_036413 [Brassica carinata]|uniref:Uncharacterized protein n=1 Tax=Brassica carinata TaxID=52824 RepID=A0A8X7V3P1_BRACI|nr:hypothetical protein Bca52824_036413 [Brassica carinata]
MPMGRDKCHGWTSGYGRLCSNAKPSLNAENWPLVIVVSVNEISTFKVLAMGTNSGSRPSKVISLHCCESSGYSKMVHQTSSSMVTIWLESRSCWTNILAYESKSGQVDIGNYAVINKAITLTIG